MTQKSMAACKTSLVLAVMCLFGVKTEGKNAVNKAELQLMSTLFPKSALFMKDVLPLKSEKHAVNVSLQIALRQIMDIVSKMVALHN